MSGSSDGSAVGKEESGLTGDKVATEQDPDVPGPACCEILQTESPSQNKFRVFRNFTRNH